MTPFTSEQIAKAREMDLLTYLQTFAPGELVPCGNESYCTATHDSLKISNGKWYWFSRGIGGKSALDYLTKVQGLPFPAAVEQIIHAAPADVPRYVPAKSSPKPFILPPRHADNRRVFSYLRARGIDPEIIHHCIKTGQLYEDAAHHNCVFVGYCGDDPRYAALRSSYSNSTFAGEASGSDKRFSFCLPRRAANNECLFVFESAIDALSYLSLVKLSDGNWQEYNCLSLGGIHGGIGRCTHLPSALEQYLKSNSHIRSIVLCFDNDEPGRKAAAEYEKLLVGYEVVTCLPDIGKDYNDLLQSTLGISRQARMRGEAR